MDNTHTELTPLDLHDAKLAAERDGQRGIHILRNAAYMTHQLQLTIEGEIEDPAYQDKACDLAKRINQSLVEVGNMLANAVAIIAALSAGFETLLQQRNDALDQRRDYQRQQRDRVADAFGWTLDDADKFLAFATMTDEELMAYDLSFDLELLCELRDQFSALLTDIDQAVD